MKVVRGSGENIRTVWKHNYARFTHCDNRPPWEIVIRILSAKYTDDTMVCVPLTDPAACFDGAGNRVGSTPPSILSSWRPVGRFDVVILMNEVVFV